MPRFRAFAEMWLVLSVWPILTLGAIYGTWKSMLWAYGGPKEFYMVNIEEPMEEKWYQTNPKKFFLRDAPLSGIPKEKPDTLVSDLTAQKEHPHQRNW